MSESYANLAFERPGHATVRIETAAGTVAYVDPWSDVILGRPGDADVVFVTHDDFDHYDPDAIGAVTGGKATVVAFDGVDVADLTESEGVYDVVAAPEEGPVPLESVADPTVAGLSVRTVPAYNEATGPHVDDAGDPFHPKGEGVGFLIEFDGTVVFVAGDTDHLPHHDALDPDVTVVPIGGHYTMDRHEAAELVETQDPYLALPVHYDTFAAIETDERAFETEVEAAGIRVELF